MLDWRPSAVTLPDPITVDVGREPTRTTLRVAGELDLLTIARLQHPLEAAVDAGEDIVLDLRDVQFIDSTGLRLLLECRGRLERTGVGRLSLVLDDTGPVRRLLELTGVLGLFRLA